MNEYFVNQVQNILYFVKQVQKSTYRSIKKINID